MPNWPTRPASTRDFMSWSATTIICSTRSAGTSPSGSKRFSAGCCRPPRATPPSWSIPAASRPGSMAARCHSLDDRVPGFQHHAARNHSCRGPGRQPAEAAPLGPRPHGQLGNARQLDHDAGNDANRRAVRRTFDPHSVPQLRRARRAEHLLRPWRRWPSMSTSIRD